VCVCVYVCAYTYNIDMYIRFFFGEAGVGVLLSVCFLSAFIWVFEFSKVGFGRI
jgi:hypothetical protein